MLPQEVLNKLSLQLDPLFVQDVLEGDDAIEKVKLSKKLYRLLLEGDEISSFKPSPVTKKAKPGADFLQEFREDLKRDKYNPEKFMRTKNGKTLTSHFAPKNNPDATLNRGNSSGF